MDIGTLAVLNGGGAAEIGNCVTYPQTGGGTYTDAGLSGVTANWVWWPHCYEPTYCMGKAHVFACDHEQKCLCGKIRRVMPRATKAK